MDGGCWPRRSASGGRSARSGLQIDLASEIDFARALGHHRPRPSSRPSVKRARPSSSGGATTARCTTACSIATGAAGGGRCRWAPALPSSPTRRGRKASRVRPTRPQESEGGGAESSPFGAQVAADADDGAEIEGVTVSPEAYSASEVMRHRDFDRMTSAELREAERLVDLLHATPRAAPHASARAASPRPPHRAARRCSGGTSPPAATSRPGSGAGPSIGRAGSSSCATSRARWSAIRALLLRFIQAFTRTTEVKAESFVFGDAAHPRHPAAQGP